MVVVRELITKFSFQVNSEAVKSFVAMLNEAESKLDGLGKKTTIKVADVKLQKQVVGLKTQELKMEGQALKNQGIKLKGDGQALKNDVVKLRLQKQAVQLKTQELKLEGQSLKNQNARLKGDWQELRNQNVKLRNEKLINTIARQKQKEQQREQAKKNKPFFKTSVKGFQSSSFVQDAYFNIELLKRAYQFFYNIAEATRQTAVNILRTNDGLNMSIAKIGVITGDTKNASKNFKELLDISAQTGSEIGVIEEIFNRLSMGKQGLGATTEQITQFTGAMAKLSAFSEGGAAQQGALRQLGQMFGGAYIQAQEWNSIVDGLPAVATKIAKAMGTTREAMTFKIRQQTKDSPAYLIKDIFPRFLKILPEIDAEFNKLPPTLDRTLNKAGVGLLKFSLNLKESFKMPELDGFYSRLDGTIKRVFEWADANKALIGTNINTFFGTLNDALKSVDTQLKDTKGTTETINNVFYLLNGTVKVLKGTFDAFLWTLNGITNVIKWIGENSAILYYLKGVGDFKEQIAFKQSLNTNPSLNNSLVGKVLPLNGMLNKNPQASFGNKGGGVTVVQNNNFNGNSATKTEQKQTARMVHPATSNAVGTAIQKRSVGH